MPPARLGRDVVSRWRAPLRRVALPALFLTIAAPPFSGFVLAQDPGQQPGPSTSWVAAADAFLRRGQLVEADRLAREQPGDDPAALLVRARVALVGGQYADAERWLVQASARDAGGDAALDLGLLQLTLGRRAQAAKTLEPLLDARGAARTADALLRAARAAHALGRFRLAHGLFGEAASAAPGHPRVLTAWADLLLEKYNLPEAVKTYEAALEADAEYAPAHLGLARSFADDNPPAAAARARQALALDPTLVGARIVLATIALDSRRTADARADLAGALEVNPQSLDARALLAAMAYLDQRPGEFRAEVDRILAINPVFGEVYRVTSARVAHAYRFDEAAALARQALAIDPENTRARADLGMHLLRTGDEDEARLALEEAFARDPFDAVTFNLLALLDTLQRFETVTAPDLVVRVDPEEAPVMSDAIVALAQEALRSLSARYGHTPRGPILIEMFPRHDDFAVRTLGLPGLVGALGACFGRVVTLDSPRARPPGSFNWTATLWHELVHVITLQMSSQRVPRWLTEGLSVFEERRARGHWGREGEFAFVQALARGGAIPLASLPEAFSIPDLIGRAYHQASLLVEHLVDRFGEPAVHALVRAYADGSDDAQVLAAVLKSDVADLQASFDTFLDRRYGAMRAALSLPEDVSVRLDRASGDDLAVMVAAHPGSYQVQMAYSRDRAAAGDEVEAARALERAAALVPVATGSGSPRAPLAQLLAERGEVSAAMSVLEAQLAVDPTGVDQARELARLAQVAGDADRLRLGLGRLAEVTPFDAQPHTELGRLAIAAGDAQAAVAHFRRAVAAGPTDAVSAHTDLADGLLQAGRTAEARREVLVALERAPRFERAQELLLRIVDGAPQSPR